MSAHDEAIEAVARAIASLRGNPDGLAYAGPLGQIPSAYGILTLLPPSSAEHRGPFPLWTFFKAEAEAAIDQLDQHRGVL